jgi:hypothetical protein
MCQPIKKKPNQRQEPPKKFLLKPPTHPQPILDNPSLPPPLPHLPPFKIIGNYLCANYIRSHGHDLQIKRTLPNLQLTIFDMKYLSYISQG